MESASYSRRACFEKCRREFYYKYELGLKPFWDAKPLRMGSAHALACEYLDANKVSEYYAELIERAGIDVVLAEELECERDVVLALATRKLADDKLIRSVEPEVEFGFDDGLNGRFDGVLVRDDGSILIIERKLRSFMSSIRERLEFDEQVTSYVLAATRLYDVPLSMVSVQYEVMFKPRIRQRKGESLREFTDRQVEWIFNAKESDLYLTVSGNDPVLIRSEHDLRECEGRVRRFLMDLQRERELLESGEVAFPVSPNSMFSFNARSVYADLIKAGSDGEMMEALTRFEVTKD